jgi:AcrR family transcriptional regulator
MDGTRMQEIADKAKINKALLHYYYRSKQLLFEAVFKSAFSLLAPQLNKVLNDESDLFEKITKFTENYISFVIKHPYLPNFVIQELNRNPEFLLKLRAEKNFPSIDKFKLQVSDAITEGVIKPISAEQLFINIISLNIFPFIGEPLLMALVNVDKDSYNKILENRKTEVASFIINSIKI